MSMLLVSCADLNVPMDKSQRITDTNRLDAVLPTIKMLMEQDAKASVDDVNQYV